MTAVTPTPRTNHTSTSDPVPLAKTKNTPTTRPARVNPAIRKAGSRKPPLSPQPPCDVTIDLLSARSATIVSAPDAQSGVTLSGAIAGRKVRPTRTECPVGARYATSSGRTEHACADAATARVMSAVLVRSHATRGREIGSYAVTEKRRQVPDTPLSSCSPRSSNSMSGTCDQVGHRPRHQHFTCCGFRCYAGPYVY